MATRYQFVDDSGETRLAGFLVPEPGVSSAFTLVSFPFTFATAGLTAGVTVYTPTVGEILYNAWIEVLTAFDGTTPRADISQYRSGATQGLMYADQGDGWNLSAADSITNGGGPLNNLQTIQGSMLGSGSKARQLPALFDTTDPLLLVVSQDGLKGGAAIGGAAGSGRVRLLILAT